MRVVAVGVVVASTWASLAFGAPDAQKQALPAPKPAAPLAPPPPVMPEDVAVEVTTDTVVASNVRAAAVLYRAACLDEMKLFDVADRVATSIRDQRVAVRSEAARKKVAAYERGKSDRLSKAERTEIVSFVSELVQLDFEKGVTDTSAQMKAYAELVSSVAQSIDKFADDNVAPDSERDRLAEDTRKASLDLGLSMSNRGYGAAHLAASRLNAEIRDALALLADTEVQTAFGARSMHDLIAGQAGTSTSDVARLERRADRGARLLDVLADNAALLGDKTKARELARRLAREAASARTWLADKPARALPTPPKKLRLLCFDGARRLAPCRVQRR